MLLVLTLLVAACGHQKSSASLHFERSEKTLFDTPVEKLQQQLVQDQEKYNTHLLNLHPQDPQFMNMLAGFVQDPVVRDIYRITDSIFPDMTPYEETLAEVVEQMRKLLPNMQVKKFYTMVSGQFDYTYRVFCDESSLVVTLDQYALGAMERYGYFGCPMYIVALSKPEYLVSDVVTTLAREQVAFTESEEVTLLDHIVAEGKVMYLLEQLMPDTPDTLLLRYTGEQLEWMDHSEKQVWAYFIQNKLLYETDYMRYHNFVDEAPKTNAFRDSAPRTTAYIGRQIVRQYMKKNKQATIAELFDNANAQQILSESGYRP